MQRPDLNTMVVVGTRPEAIKMAPVIHEFKKRRRCCLHVVNTAQHRDLVDQAFSMFGLNADSDLNLMEKDQTLLSLLTKGSEAFEQTLIAHKPDVLLVEGDTTTVFFASLMAFYHKVDVAHVEAGLRTADIYSPFPEEVNRRITSVVTTLHFAPTEWAKKNLLREGHRESDIYITGNPVIDAFLEVLEMEPCFSEILNSIDFDRFKVILVTAHRRENHGKPLENICRAILQLRDTFEDILFLYPVHPHPMVENIVQPLLSGKQRIIVVPPLDYLSFVHLMKRSHLILTDSGGIQEEAPSIGKPTLVLRNTTERPEAIDAGTAKVIGTETENIVREVSSLISDEVKYRNMTTKRNPFGDGNAAKRIVDIVLERYG